MICNSTQYLQAVHLIDLPDSWQSDWRNRPCSLIKKNYKRFDELPRLVTIPLSDDISEITMQTLNDNCYPIDGYVWRRESGKLVFKTAVDVREKFLGGLDLNGYVYVILATTERHSLNWYTALVVDSFGFNGDGDYEITVKPQLKTLINGQYTGRVE